MKSRVTVKRSNLPTNRPYMITAIIVYFPNGEKKTYTVGEGVRSIFLDREDKSHIVLLMEDNIVEIAGLPFVAQKDYKDKNKDEDE